MLKKSTKPKFNYIVNFNEFQSNVEVAEKESTKESSYSIDLIKKNVVNKTIYDIIAEIECYNPVSKFIDMYQLRQNTNVKMKRYRYCVFFGEFVETKKYGSGIMIYTNGRIYEGQWRNNYKYGQGYERFVNLSVYTGEYRKGKPHGYGRYEWQSGENYEGQWVDGVKDGSGIWRGSQGDSYIGEWKDDKAEGYGVHTWINGNRYEGQFKQCLKCGEGIYKFANGDTYKGYYENGKPHGYGEYFWNDGSSYKGEFRYGLRCGKGIWRKSNHPSADTYEGYFKNEKKYGYGVFIWSNGCKYIGKFMEDLRNGYGEMYWSDGTVYKGEWRNGEQVEEIIIHYQYQYHQQYHQTPFNADFINISYQFKRVSTSNHTKRSKSKLNPTYILISNPYNALEFFPNTYQNEPEIIELKRFRARYLASRSKSRILERSMGNADKADKGFFDDGNNNFFHYRIPSGNHVEKNPRKMQKKSSGLSFNTTRSPYLMQNSEKGIIKHSQSTTEGRPMSVCLYSHSKSSNKSVRNIPIKNFQGVELNRDHFDRPSMIYSRSNSKTKPRMIRSSNGVRNMSHHPYNFECFWEYKPTKNLKSNKIATTNEEIKWFTRSKNYLKYY